MAVHEALKKPLFLSLNICSSVLIVLVNRFVMSSFKFVSLLSGLHLLVSGVFVRVFQGQKGSSDTKLDVGTILLIVWTVSSLESLNASLMLNTVSFYQVRRIACPLCILQTTTLTTIHAIMGTGNKTFDYSLLCNHRVLFWGQAFISMAAFIFDSNSRWSRTGND